MSSELGADRAACSARSSRFPVLLRPHRRTARRRSTDLAEYRWRTTGLGCRADRPDRVDVPRRLVGGDPGSAGVGGAAAGRCGDLRDRAAWIRCRRRCRPRCASRSDTSARRGCGAGRATDTAGCSRRLSPVARPALPPHLSAEYLEMTRERNRFQPTGHSRSWRRCRRCTSPTHTAGRITGGRAPSPRSPNGRQQHDVPLVDLKAAVGDACDVRAGQSRRHPLELRGAPGRRRADAEGVGRSRRDARDRSRLAIHGCRGCHRLVVAVAR